MKNQTLTTIEKMEKEIKEHNAFLNMIEAYNETEEIIATMENEVEEHNDFLKMIQDDFDKMEDEDCEECFGLGTIELFSGNPPKLTIINCPSCKGSKPPQTTENAAYTFKWDMQDRTIKFSANSSAKDQREIKALI